MLPFGGRWWRSHQRGGRIAIARQGGCLVLLYETFFIILRTPTKASAPAA